MQHSKYEKTEKNLEYFKEMNDKMKFTGTDLEILPNMVKEDTGLREHFKLMLNASIGKFGQHTQPTKTRFVQTQVCYINQ